MVLISLVLFVAILHPPQDSPRNEVELASRLRSPTEFANSSSLSRYTYQVEIPGRKIEPSFQFYKFEMLTVSQFVMHSTNYVARDVAVPDAFEFTGFFNSEYASGLKNNGEDFSMINVAPSAASEANKANYLSNLFFPVDHDETFVEVFAGSDAIVQGYTISGDGKTATVNFSIDEKQWTATFDLERMICIGQIYNCPSVKHLLGIEIAVSFGKVSEKFPSKISMKMTQPGNASIIGIHEYLEYREDISIADDQTYLSHYGFPEPDFGKPKSIWIRIAGIAGIICCLAGLIYVFRRKQ